MVLGNLVLRGIDGEPLIGLSGGSSLVRLSVDGDGWMMELVGVKPGIPNASRLLSTASSCWKVSEPEA